MRPQRTFRPAVLDQLEERRVPSAASAHLPGLAANAAATVSPRAFAISHAIGANNGHLNLRNRTIGNSVFAATTPVPVTTITATPAISSGSSLLGSSARTLGLSGLTFAPGGVAFTNSAAPIGANTGLTPFSSGVSTGLAFNGGLGAPGNLGTAINNGALTGLAFNDGLGVTSNPVTSGFFNNNGSGFGAASGLVFNNGFGTTVPAASGTTSIPNGIATSTGANFNNGQGVTNNPFTSGTIANSPNAFLTSSGLNFTNGFGTTATPSNVAGLNFGFGSPFNGFGGGINRNQFSAVNALTTGVGFNGTGLGLTGFGNTANPTFNNFGGTPLMTI